MIVRSHLKAAISDHAAAIILIILFAAAARFVLILNLPIRILSNDVLGDALHLRLATNLESGVGIGEFNQFSLVKGPGYPLFLAATNFSGLPLSVAHALFQTAAITAVAWTAFRLTRSRSGAEATFIALAFCPVGIALHRVLPEQIYWAQTLLAFSLLAILLYAPPHGRFSAVVLAGLTGLVFGWASLTDEGSGWLFPACAVLSVGAILAKRYSREKLLALARNFCVAAAFFVAVNVAFLTTNLNVYGSRTSNTQWLPRNLVAAVETVWHPDLAATTPFCSVSVESAGFERYWTFLNKPHVRMVQPTREVTAVGWYYNSRSIEWPVIKAYDQDGQETPLSLTRQASPDLQRYFSDDRAGDNRFQIKFGSPDVCTITALTPDAPELRVVIDLKENLYAASDSALFSIDTVLDSAGGAVDLGEKLAGSVSYSLIGLYEGLLPFLLPIGLIAAVAASWRAWSAQVLPPMLLTALAAWILAATGLVKLGLFDIPAAPTLTIHYFPPANYMAIVAACFSLIALSVGSRAE
jgi:hypothetical protein